MQKYQILSKAGSGNFSDVYKARNRLTDEVVAIKEMKYSQDLEQLTRKELQIISQLDHPNIIKVKQILRNKKDVKVVFEYMDETLLELYQSSRLGINQNQIKCILFQAACALQYLHKCKIIHRDIKPENLLINRKLALVKLIDFGLAKEDYLASTDYVATRWYRSPQNLLGMRKSSTAMDIFALGCVAVQLFSLNPLFPGQNTLDQLYKIIGILGTPTMQNWPQGYRQIKRKNISLPTKSPINLKYVLPNASPDLLNLLQQMLQLNPSRRITARQIILHPFFANVQKFIPDHVYKQFKKTKLQNDLKKPRKISPMHSSPLSDKKFMYPATASSLSSYNNYPMSNIKQKTPPKVDSNHNSRVSIQNKYYRDLSTDSKKLLPKQWDSKRTPVKHQQNSPTKFVLTNQKSDSQYKQNSRMRHYFSRDNLNTKSLDKSYKPKYFQMKKDSGVVIKTLGDEIKFNVRNTAGSRNEMIKRQSQTSEMKPSPRYNVKYFKDSYQKNKEDTSRQRKYEFIRNDTNEKYDNNPMNKVNRNKSVGLSVERNFLSQNKTFNAKVYLNKPSFQGSFRKQY